MPLHPSGVTLEMGSLFWVSRSDRAELHGIASGTGEDRVKEKATQAMKVLSIVEFDWQIVVENGIRNILLSPFQTENKNSNTAMSETRK